MRTSNAYIGVQRQTDRESWKAETIFYYEVMVSYTMQHLCMWMAVPGTDTCQAAWYHWAFAETQSGFTQLMLWALTATWMLSGWAGSVPWPHALRVFQLGMASSGQSSDAMEKSRKDNFFVHMINAFLKVQDKNNPLAFVLIPEVI